MPPATLTPARPHGHLPEPAPPQAPAADVTAARPAEVREGHPFDASLVDPVALESARDAVNRYLGELGLAVNSRPARAATAACLDAAFGEVGPTAGPIELSRAALRHAALGMSRWLTGLSDRGPTPPRHASLAARLSAGRAAAVPEDRRRAMTPQRFGR